MATDTSETLCETSWITALESIEDYTVKVQQLSAALRSGFFNLAQARYT